jgi:hypothetical protein
MVDLNAAGYAAITLPVQAALSGIK